MDRLEAMAVFVAVADLRGFAPAARRVGLSPVAVTRQVAALEEHLGVRLLQRTTRSVTLTDAGARFLERARRIVADAAEAEASAQAERSEPTGRFTLTAPSLFGRLHVAPLFCAYLSRYAKVTGQLTLSDRRVNLIEEGFDAAVRIGHLEDSALIARRVGQTRRVTLAAPDYLRQRGVPSRAEELVDHDLIQFTGVTPSVDWKYFGSAGDRSVLARARFITNGAEAALQHAEGGGGIVVALAYQAAHLVQSGRLRIVLAEEEPPPLPIHIVYPGARLLSAKVRSFLELVQAEADWNFGERLEAPLTTQAGGRAQAKRS